MARYLIRRLASALAVVLLVMAALAAATRLIPGNLATTEYGAHAAPALVQALDQQMGLNVPVPVQVWHFILHAAQGNLGTDVVSGHSVMNLVASALPDTIVLVAAGLLLALIAGVPLGVLAASKPGSLADKVTGVLSVGLMALPYYVVGLLLILVFGVALRALPVIGAGSGGGPGSYVSHLVLPAVALAAAWVGYLARLIRANMIEVLTANHIRMMRGFGVRQSRIFYKYALKIAAAPAISVLGVGFGNLLGGTIFIEVIFDRPGLGTLLYNAIQARNYTVVQGTVLVIALLLIAANLASDLVHTSLDKRIEVGGHGAA
jgi:peptide/nickel transport system permease protein